MLIVIGDATAAPGRRDELVAAARAVAAATRGDEGLPVLLLLRRRGGRDRILSIEIWADQAALDAHMDPRPHPEFLRVAPGLVAGEPPCPSTRCPDAGERV